MGIIEKVCVRERKKEREGEREMRIKKKVEEKLSEWSGFLFRDSQNIPSGLNKQ